MEDLQLPVTSLLSSDWTTSVSNRLHSFCGSVQGVRFPYLGSVEGNLKQNLWLQRGQNQIQTEAESRPFAAVLMFSSQVIKPNQLNIKLVGPIRSIGPKCVEADLGFCV